MTRNALFAFCLLAATPVDAADRGFTITSFDRIRVEGPYAVTVVTGAPPSVRASGDARALDAVDARVEGRTLTIRRQSGSMGSMTGAREGRVTIAVSTHDLTSISLAGAGSLEADRMRGARLDLLAAGSGRIQVGRVETDLLAAGIAGSGGIKVAGTAATARFVLRGAGDIDAANLVAADAEVTSDGSGAVSLTAQRSARVTANGPGDVTVTGDAACQVRAQGSGLVTCGR